jgi:ketosteroid isomerase-like protein
VKIRNRHIRTVAAPPHRIAALLADFDRVWPTEIAPAPRPRGHRSFDAGPMLWEEFDRPGAARAFRVVKPDQLQGEHWFELERREGATVIRHTVDANPVGKYEAIWCERIEPLHDLILEALLGNVETAVTSSTHRRTAQDRADRAAGVVLDAFAAVEQRDRDRLEALYHPEVEFHWPPSLLARRPGQSWEQVWDPLQPTHKERSMNPRVVAANDREVVVLWRQRGVSTDGERFDGEVLGLYDVRDSKFARAQMFYFDTAAVLQFLEPRTHTPGPMQ